MRHCFKGHQTERLLASVRKRLSIQIDRKNVNLCVFIYIKFTCQIKLGKLESADRYSNMPYRKILRGLNPTLHSAVRGIAWGRSDVCSGRLVRSVHTGSGSIPSLTTASSEHKENGANTSQTWRVPCFVIDLLSLRSKIVICSTNINRSFYSRIPLVSRRRRCLFPDSLGTQLNERKAEEHLRAFAHTSFRAWKPSSVTRKHRSAAKL